MSGTETMEARDVVRATTMLAPGFAMMFPGAASFTQHADFLAWAKPRYRWMKKRYERFDEAPGSAGGTIVSCFGTLYGEWPDGRPFEGIRFIARFVIRGGDLADQLV